MTDLFDRALNLGMRITAQRRVICRVLEQADDHPDVDTLHLRVREQDPNVSLACVYRTMKILEGMDLVIRHDFGEGRHRFEVNNDQHHDHLVDLKTGKVIEFHDKDLEALQEAIAERLGYELTGHTLALYGRPVRTS